MSVSESLTVLDVRNLATSGLDEELAVRWQRWSRRERASPHVTPGRRTAGGMVQVSCLEDVRPLRAPYQAVWRLGQSAPTEPQPCGVTGQ